MTVKLARKSVLKRKTRNLAAGLAGFALNLSGSVARAHNRIKAGNILSLCFHNPQRDLFRKIIYWLNDKKFSFISTQNLVHILKRQQYPKKKSAWITFDDGWRDNLEYVIPVLTEFDIPATFFISTYPAKSSGYFWWTAINRHKKKLPKKFRSDLFELWRRPWSEIEQIVKEILGDETAIQREAMTVQEIIDISKLSQVTIGGHGVYHLITKYCSEGELISELADAKIELETWIKKPVKHFAYPRGIYSQRDKSVLQECGYELAAGTENRLISAHTDLYAVPRFSVFDEAYYYEALCRVVGIWEPFVDRFSN